MAGIQEVRKHSEPGQQLRLVRRDSLLLELLLQAHRVRVWRYVLDLLRAVLLALWAEQPKVPFPALVP